MRRSLILSGFAVLAFPTAALAAEGATGGWIGPFAVIAAGIGMAIAAAFLPGSSMSADDPKTPRFLAAPIADTVFFQGQIDVVGGEGKVVRCKDDGTYRRCFEVKNAGRSN